MCGGRHHTAHPDGIQAAAAPTAASTLRIQTVFACGYSGLFFGLFMRDYPVVTAASRHAFAAALAERGSALPIPAPMVHDRSSLTTPSSPW